MRQVLRAAHAVACAAAAVLLGTVALSIAGRLVFDLSGGQLNLVVPGAIEISRYALMVMVFAALPGSAIHGMVRVDILLSRLPPHLGRALERLWRFVAAALAGALTWLFAEEAWLQAGRGDVTQDLELPLWPFTGFAAIASATLLIVALNSALVARQGKP